MTSAAVNNSFFQAAQMAMPAGRAQKSGDINQNFGDVFDNAGKSLQQSDTQKAQNMQTVKADGQPKQTDEAGKTLQAAEKTENVETTDVTNNPQTVAEEAEPIDEALAEEINDAVKQIIEELKKILGISDEELMNVMASLGIQPLDLLNSELMSQLLSAVTGEDAITLVADENMYAALNEMTGAVDETVADLMESAGLTEEELDATLEQLKEIAPDAETPTVELQPQALPEIVTETGAEIDKNNDDGISAQQAQRQAASETAPEIIVEDKTKTVKADTNIVSDRQTASDNQTASNDSKAELFAADEKKPGEEKENHSDAKSYENHQNSFDQNSQNKLDSTVETAQEIKPQSYISENTYDIMRQLADTVKILKTEQLTQMEMQLHPASLGTVNVSLTTKGGVLTAEFITQNEAVKAAIETQAVQLRENLEQQGVKVEAIEVSVASHQMEKNLDKNGQEQRSAEQQETQRVQGLRRRSINFNSFENGDELAGEYDGADDATRIAMEMMSMNGASMDLLA